MIFYFSGTGNTRWVARQLAEATGETLYDIAKELLKAQIEGTHQVLDYQLQAGERLGFCFPTHGWQPPHIFREFIRRATFHTGADTYCFAVTTCGDNMGEAMTIFNKELLRHHVQAVSQFSVIMPESYVCLPFMKTDSDERVSEKINAARQQLPHIIDVISQRKAGVIELERGATPRLYSYVIGGYFNRHMISDKKFTVDADVCTRCGLCQRICPVEDIKGTPPVWQHNGHCTSCLACYHHCPVHAINYGNITRKRGQYVMKSVESNS